MNTIFKLAIVSLILLATRADAQNRILETVKPKQKVAQFQMSEWLIRLSANFKNPYLQEEITLDMVLTSASGKHVVLPCFYEEGPSGAPSLWKARFLPQEPGIYHYHFELRIPGTAMVSTPVEQINAVRSKTGKGILHTGNDWTFRFDDGTPFRGIGENIAWESRANDDSRFFKALHEKEKYNYEYMLPALAHHGGNYFRTWICSWNLPLDWKSGFNSHRYSNSDAYFNPSAIRKMDRLVNLSDSLHLYMMLTLGEGAHDERNGRFATSTPDFFVNEKAKAQYRNRLRFIVARWGYSPAIGAWEFFNEIDNVQFRNAEHPIDPAHIVQWHDEMSTYLKQLDPYHHLITTSISHRDLKGLNSLTNIDFNQKHIYKNNRALPTTIVQYLHDFKKPYVIGEYGYEYDWSKNFNDFAEEMDSDFKRGLWYGLFSPTPVIPLSWWWEFFDDRGTDKYIRRVRVISDLMLSAGKGSFEVKEVRDFAPGLEAFAVRCGKTSFVYLFNPGKDSVKTGLSLNWLQGMPSSFEQYDCETGVFSRRRIAKSTGLSHIENLELAPQRDKVLIIRN